MLSEGETYTFWGKGLSQGHSDAVRRVAGVKAGVQYTLPSEAAIERVRAGEQPQLTTREKHVRECYVVLEADASADAVRNSIVTMPDYFADSYIYRIKDKIRFLDWIYKDCNIYLDRKYQKYINVKNCIHSIWPRHAEMYGQKYSAEIGRASCRERV